MVGNKVSNSSKTSPTSNARKNIAFKTKSGKAVNFTANNKGTDSKSSKTTLTSKSKVTRIPKIRIEEHEQNNKSRKGIYIYIKEKGKAPKYFKKVHDLTNKDYLYAYKNKVRIHRGGLKKEIIKKEKKMVKLSTKYPQVDSIMENGMAQNTIRDGKGLSPQGIKLAYNNLLANKDRYKDGLGIVRDSLLRELLTRPDMVEKWKFRVQFEIEITGENGDRIVVITNTNVKTLSDIKKEVIDNVNIGQDYESQYKQIGKVINNGYKLEGNGFDKGKVRNISIKMTYRKGT